MGIVKYFIFLQVIHYTAQYIVGWELFKYFIFLQAIHYTPQYIVGWGLFKYFIFLQAIHYTPQYIVGWGLLSTLYFYKLYIIHLNILLGGDCLILYISSSYTLYTLIYCWMVIVKYFIFLQVMHSTPQYIVGWGLLSTSYFYKLYIIHLNILLGGDC